MARNIKKFTVSTKEGITFSNIELFPSMEWGDEGGHSATIIYKDKEIGTYFQQGNGGQANICLNKMSEELKKQFEKDVTEASYRLETVHYPELTFHTDDHIENIFEILLGKEDTLKYYKKISAKYPKIIVAEISTSWQSKCIAQNKLYLANKYSIDVNNCEAMIKYMEQELSPKYILGKESHEMGNSIIEKICYFCSINDFKNL